MPGGETPPVQEGGRDRTLIYKEKGARYTFSNKNVFWHLLEGCLALKCPQLEPFTSGTT